jgi:hypothetical protein
MKRLVTIVASLLALGLAGTAGAAQARGCPHTDVDFYAIKVSGGATCRDAHYVFDALYTHGFSAQGTYTVLAPRTGWAWRCVLRANSVGSSLTCRVRGPLVKAELGHGGGVVRARIAYDL